MDDQPRTGTYACVERERRFLVERLPEAIDPDDHERLDDLYVRGTHLRLRRVTRPDGAFVVAKLGQKIVNPAAPTDPRRRQMTTLYLPEGEADALGAFDGLRTVKRRYRLREQGLTFCIDVWEEPPSARGRVVAEVEASLDEELAASLTDGTARRSCCRPGRSSRRRRRRGCP